jgi:hypothetical protein
MLIRGKQIATGDDGITATNIKDSTITPGKCNLATAWAFTVNPTMNANPSNDNDLARKAYVDSVAAGLSWKESVRAATAAAGTLASDFEDGDTIDTTVTLATGDRILIKNQATGSENGIYVVQASGAPVRAADLPATASAAGIAVFVEEGTDNADKGYVCTNDDGSDVVGTDALVFSQFTGVGTDANAVHVNVSAEISGVTEKETPVSADLLLIEDSAATNAKKRVQVGNLPFADIAAATAGAALADTAAAGDATDAARANHVHPRDDEQQEELTTEAITGTDTALTDTLTSTPINNASVHLYLNGIHQVQGAGKDYTISGQTITWLASSGTAVDMDTSDSLVVRYVSQGA